MGVSTTGAIFKGLIFNGINSKDYGVYITGEAVYNAPERDVEIIEIAGRNGAFVRDNGRFNNVVVTYSAGMFGDAQTDFAEGISEFRNAICAAKGYCRLTDEYNPDEYREAVYKSGLEVSPALMGRAGEFTITFECKPQRFLLEGENVETISASGDTLENPTRYPSRPLLEVTGYGKIGINEDEVEIISGPIGRVPLVINRQYPSQPAGLSASFQINVNGASLNNGDKVYCNGIQLTVDLGINIGALESFTQSGNIIQGASGTNTNAVKFDFYNFTFAKGTRRTGSASVSAGYYVGGGVTYQTISVSVSISTAGVITITVSANLGADAFGLYVANIFGNSTKSALGDPVYLDLDIGEAYKIEGGAVVGVNSAVSLGAELPELKAGENVFTFPATITALKVKPRWWKV